MAIMIPGWLQWLDWVAGSEWPEGNEDLQKELGEALAEISGDLRDKAVPEAETAIRSLLVAYPEGDGKEKIRQELDKLISGDGSLETIAKVFEQMGDSAIEYAGQIRSGKLNVIFSLAWLAAELAYAAFLGPGAPFAQAGLTAATQTAIRWLGSALLNRIASVVGRMAISRAAQDIVIKVVYEIVQEAIVEVLQGTIQEVAIQGLNVSQGFQKEMNWGQVGQNALISGIAGGAGGATGFGARAAMNRTGLGDARFQGLFKGIVVGGTAGLGGAVAAYVSTGAITGQWDLDPRMFVGGALSGMGPSAIYGWRGLTDFGGGPMPNMPNPTVNIGGMPGSPDGPTPGPSGPSPDGPGSPPDGSASNPGSTQSNGAQPTSPNGAGAAQNTNGGAAQNTGEGAGQRNGAGHAGTQPSSTGGGEQSGQGGGDRGTAPAGDQSASGDRATSESGERSSSEDGGQNGRSEHGRSTDTDAAGKPEGASGDTRADSGGDKPSGSTPTDGARPAGVSPALDGAQTQGVGGTAESGGTSANTGAAQGDIGSPPAGTPLAGATATPSGVAPAASGPVAGQPAQAAQSGAPAPGTSSASPVRRNPAMDGDDVPPRGTSVFDGTSPRPGESSARTPGADTDTAASRPRAGAASVSTNSGVADPGVLQANTADAEARSAVDPTPVQSDPDADTGADQVAPVVIPAAPPVAPPETGTRAGEGSRSATREAPADAEAGAGSRPDADTDPDANADPDTAAIPPDADDPGDGARPRRSVLPEDISPPTDSEARAAESAVRKLAEQRDGAELRDLLHNEGTTSRARARELARANARWWDSLSPDERAAMVRTHPRTIGRAPGIDMDSADAANRLRIAREIDDLLSRDTLSDAERTQLSNLRSTVRALAAAQAQADAKAPGLPVRVLAFDSTAFGGKGSAAVAFGDVDAADRVAWHVGGRGQSVGSLGASLGTALNMHLSAADSVRGGGSLASIAWVGYDAPPGKGNGPRAALQSVTLTRAREGARLLLRDVAAADAARSARADGGAPARNKIIAHGYGVDVAEAAGRGGRLAGLASDVVLGGLPGDGRIRPGRFGDDVRVHVTDENGRLYRTLGTAQRATLPGGVPAVAMYRIDAVVADLVGTAEHRAPDAVPADGDRPAVPDRPETSENNCFESALWRASVQTGNPSIALFEPGTVGPEGVSWQRAQDAAGGELTPITGHRDRSPHQVIADGLAELGGRATAVVVDQGGPVDEHGVGAHSYTMYYDADTDRVMVDDPRRADEPFVFDPDDTPDADSTWGIFYGPDGELMRPVTAAQTTETASATRPGTTIGDTDSRADDDPPHRTVDEPITDAEINLAASAVRDLDGGDPTRLRHGDDDLGPATDAATRDRARANSDWWHRLDDDQQAAMVRVHPELVGNADGIPAKVRDRANRLALERDLGSFRARTPERLGVGQVVNPEFNRAEPDQLRNMIRTREALARAERLADALDPGVPRPPVRLLSYDAASFGGHGRALVAFGDLDRAVSVAWHVPDSGTSLRRIDDHVTAAAAHYESTARAAADRPVASVAWVGARTPANRLVPGADRLARRGGDLLVRDLIGFDATRAAAAARGEGPAHSNHLFGHRHGATTVGHAGRGRRLAALVDTVTLVGAHEVGPIRSAAEFGIGRDVFVATSERDRGASFTAVPARLAGAITATGPVDPTAESFGARRVPVDTPHNRRAPLSELYFHADPEGRLPSEALRHFGRIAAGEDLGPAAHTHPGDPAPLVVRDGTAPVPPADGAPRAEAGLPIDREPTAEERKLAEDAVRHLRTLLPPEVGAGAPARPEAQLLTMLSHPVPPGDVVDASARRAEANATWWHALTHVQRSALAVTYPRVIGNADGIPAADRSAANELAMARDLRRLVELGDTGGRRPNLTPDQWRELRNIVTARDELAAMRRRADRALGSPPVQLISYDPGAFQGKGKIVVALGDLDRASSVSWHVSGRGTTLTDVGTRMSFARAQFEVTSKLTADADADVASVVWIGYDHPDTRPEAGNPRRAAVGGYLLARDIAAWHVSRAHTAPDGPGAAHLIAHGFGAVTAGFAGAEGRLAGRIATVTLLGPAGSGPIRTADDFGIGRDNVFVAAAPGDPVANRGRSDRVLRRGLGADPVSDAFGARRIPARYPDTREFAGRRGAHRGYLAHTDFHTRTPTASLANVGLIAAGRGDEIATPDQAPARAKPSSRVVTAADVSRAFAEARGERPAHAIPVDAGPDRDAPRWSPDRVLPPDTAVTEADRVAAQELLDRLAPGARPARLLHAVDPADIMGSARERTTENARWWHSLTTEERALLVRTHPRQVGNADGIPAHVRDYANRLALARDLAAFAGQVPEGTDPEQWMRSQLDGTTRLEVENLVYTWRALAVAEERVGRLHPNVARPPVHLIGFSATEFRHAGRAVLSFGNIDTADSVAWQIPGITTTAQHMRARMGNSLNLYEVASRMAPEREIASVAWIGYDAPSGKTMATETVSQLPAEEGGKLLARDMAGFNAARDFYADKGGPGRTENHILAHSYGSTTTGHAGANGRLAGEVTTITLLGSPGAGPLRHASDFGIGAENVYVAIGSRDPVTFVGANIPGLPGRFAGRGQGTDPAIAAFGAQRVRAEFPRVPRFSDGLRTHRQYWQYTEWAHRTPTEALENFGLIVSGRADEVSRAEHRPGVEEPTWLQRRVGSLPRDPEAARVATIEHGSPKYRRPDDPGPVAPGRDPSDGPGDGTSPHPKASRPDAAALASGRAEPTSDPAESEAAESDSETTPPAPESPRTDGDDEVPPAPGDADDGSRGPGDPGERGAMPDPADDGDRQFALSDLLPVDRRPTGEQLRLAQELLDRRAPGGGPDRLAHGDYADAEAVASARDLASANSQWWRGLSAAERMAVVSAHPRDVGNADGIPAVARDYANRLAIVREMADLRAVHSSDRTKEQHTRLANLHTTVAALAEADRMARETGGDTPPVHLLSFDAGAFEGKGRAVLAIGDVDTADSVSWHVPGIKTDLGKLAWNADFARNHYEVTTRRAPGRSVASIAWLGYGAPTGYTGAFRLGPARAGGALLARDIAAFNASRESSAARGGPARPDNHVFGHSYGSTTTSFAGGAGRLAREVSTITLAASPGAGPVGHAREFGVGDNVFVATQSTDKVTWVGGNRAGWMSRFLGVGIDPSVAAFGARRVTAEYPDTAAFAEPRKHHTQYYDYVDASRTRPTEALENFARIAAGLGDTVTPEPHRPGMGDANVFRRVLGKVPKVDFAAKGGIDDGTHGYRPVDGPVTRPVGPEVQGHRGGRGLWAENTLPGFRAAMRMGVDGIELDIGLTSDGVPVVHHEQHVDKRTIRDTDPDNTYVGQKIRDLTLDQIRTLDAAVVNPAFADTQRAEPGAGIPTFDEVIALARETGWRGTLAVEIKTDPSWPDADVRAVVSAVTGALRGQGVDFRILGFDWRVLTHAAELAPDAERVALVSARTATETWLGRDPGISRRERARMLWAQVTRKPRDAGGDLAAAARDAGATILSPERSMVTEKLVRQAESADIGVSVWTVNDPADMHRLIELGVDTIVTDFPDRLRDVMAHRGRALPEPPPTPPDTGGPRRALPGHVTDLLAHLRSLGADPAALGGVAANVYRADPRPTEDVDLLIREAGDLPRRLREAGYEVTTTENADDEIYLIRARRDGRAVDLIVAEEPVQIAALDRAFDGVISIEDILVLKLIGGRPKDRADIDAILSAGHRLDLGYIERQAGEWEVTREWQDARDRLGTPLEDSGPGAIDPTRTPPGIDPPSTEPDEDGDDGPGAAAGGHDGGGRGPGTPPVPAVPSEPGGDGDGQFALTDVLPTDRRPTEDESRLARELLDRRSPGAGPDRLLHGDYADTETVTSARDRAAANARWWDGLNAAERRTVVLAHPRELGNADGIPAVARDYANRLAIVRDLVDLRAVHSSARTDAQRTALANLETTVAALVDADRMARETGLAEDLATPPVHLLSFDAGAFGGKGRAVLAIGDVDSADSVSWHVPGIKTDLGKLAWNTDFARNHFEVTSRRAPGRAVASIAWLGYGAPSGYSGAFRLGPAREGGASLARDIAAFNASREVRTGRPDNHVFGHSYGSTTTSYAGGGGRLSHEVSSITLAASPGAGPVGHAREFGVGDNVFVATLSTDKVTWVGGNRAGRASRFLGVGVDPSIEAFGARRVTAQYPDTAEFADSRRHHTQYYDYVDASRTRPTEALENFGRIAAGLGDTVTPEPHRPGVGDVNVFRRVIGKVPKVDPATTAGIDDGTQGYRPVDGPVTRPTGPEVQGHRGGRGLWSENTLPAFESAMRMGVDGIELDVGLTSDGVPVVHHEQRIDKRTIRDTDPDHRYVGQRIRDLTLDQVRTLDAAVVHPGFADTQRAEPGALVPTLDEVARLAADTGWDGTFSVEIKTDPSWPDAEVRAVVDAAVRTMRAHGANFRVLGFDWRVLTHAAELAPDAERVALVSARTASETWLGRDPGVSRGERARMLWAQLTGKPRDAGGDLAAAAREAGATILSPERSMVTEKLVRQAESADVRLSVWTVNKPADMHRVIGLGVDAIVTDFPDRLRDVMEHRGRALPEPAVPPTLPSDPGLDARDVDAAARALDRFPVRPAVRAEDTDATVTAAHRAWALENRRVWDSLDGAHRNAMLRAHPETVGAMDGLPTDLRDRANRLAHRRAWRELGERIGANPRAFRHFGTKPLNEPEFAIVRRLLFTDAAVPSDAVPDRMPDWSGRGARRLLRAMGPDATLLADLTAMSELLVRADRDAAGSPGSPPVRVLVFDPTAYQGDGRAVIALGDIDTADHVAWHVPGAAATVRSMNQSMHAVHNLYDTAARTAPESSHAAVLWLGYDPPSGGAMWAQYASTGPARAGGRSLLGDLAAFNAVRDAGERGRPAVHLIGHGYGSTAVGYAGADGGLARQVADVTLVGSPGVGPVTDAGQFGLGADRVFALTATSDRLTWRGAHTPAAIAGPDARVLGVDPASAGFGAVRVAAEFPVAPRFASILAERNQYFWYTDPSRTVPTEALDNLGRITVGQADTVTTDAHRPGTRETVRFLGHDVDVPVDPAAERTGVVAPTAEQRALARAALDLLEPGAGPDALKHGDYDESTIEAQAAAHTDRVAGWWHEQLGAAERAALVRVYPFEIGNADGVPAAVRDQANRLQITRDFDAFLARYPHGGRATLDAAERLQLRNLVRTAQALSQMDARAAVHPDSPPVHVLSYDRSEFGGTGRAVLSVGDIDTAQSLSWIVPGITTTLDKLPGNLRAAMNVYEMTARMNPDLAIASVIWIGYETPNGSTVVQSTVGAEAAREGGRILRRDLASFRASREYDARQDISAERPHVYLLSHSYGSVATSYAGENARLAGMVDAIMLLGSPGVGPIRHASEFGVPVYVAASSGDPVTWAGADTPGRGGRFAGRGHGLDPTTRAFGAVRRVTAEFPAGMDRITQHRGYFKYLDDARTLASESLRNVALFVAERAEDMIAARSRPGLEDPGWRQRQVATPNDPESRRTAVEFDVEDTRGSADQRPATGPDADGTTEHHKPRSRWLPARREVSARPLCAIDALRVAADALPNAGVRVPDSVGPGGLTADELEQAAGGRLRMHPSPAQIASMLKREAAQTGPARPAPMMLVVDEYHGPAGRDGIGAHAYVLSVENGRVMIHDRTLGTSPQPFRRGLVPTGVLATHGILLRADGADRPVDTYPPSAHRPDVGIGERPDGSGAARRDDSDLGGTPDERSPGAASGARTPAPGRAEAVVPVTGGPRRPLPDQAVDFLSYLRELGAETAALGATAANVYRAAPRATDDIDLMIRDVGDLPARLREAGYEVATFDNEDGDVYLIRLHGKGIAADLMVAETPLQHDALDRAAGGVISVEDVIVLKLIANRAKDRGDIDAILSAGHRLELDYIQRQVVEWEATKAWRDAQARHGSPLEPAAGDARETPPARSDDKSFATPESPEREASPPTPSARDVVTEQRDASSISGPDRCTDGEPVDMATGAVLLEADDVRADGALPLSLRRVHLSSLRLGRHFGPGWLSMLDERLEIDDRGLVLVCADGALLDYPHPDATGAEVFPRSGRRLPLSLSGEVYRVRDLDAGTVREFAVAPTVAPIASITHRGGHRLDFEYGAGGVVAAVRHSGGTVLRTSTDPVTGWVTALSLDSGANTIPVAAYRYSDRGDLLGVTDASGAELRYTYDEAHRLSSWTDRNGVAYHHRYDALGRCVAQIGTGGVYANAFVHGVDDAPDAPPGGRWTVLVETVRPLDLSASGALDFDAAMDALCAMPLVREIQRAGPRVVANRAAVPDDPVFGGLRVLLFRADARGDVWQITDAVGGVRTFGRDTAHQVVRETDPSGAATVYDRDRHGLITAVTTPDGTTTRVVRGAWGEPLEEVGQGGRTWRYESDKLGNTVAVTGPDGARERYEYDYRPSGSVLRRVIDPTGLVTEVDCDDAGRPVRVTAPGGRTWTYERDDFGRIRSRIDPLGRSTGYTWTPEGKPLSQRNPDGTELVWAYDAEGNELSRVDEAGNVSTTRYTVLDSPLEVTGADGARLRIGYDTQLQITSVTNPAGLVWRYEYDPAGRLLAETDYNGARTSYTYDSAGRIRSTTDATGRRTRFVYDAAGRVLEEHSDDGVTRYRYDRHGDLVEAANPDAEVLITRDAAGRVLTERVGGVTVAVAYDRAGRRTQRIVDTRALPGAGLGRRTVFGRDDTGLLVSAATDDGQGPADIVSFGYDRAGNEIVRGVGAAVVDRRYDARDRIIAQHVRNSSGVVAGRTWTYRADGYTTGGQDVLRGARRVDVDPAGRVTAVAAERGPAPVERYAYDPAGVVTLAADPDEPALPDRVLATGTLVTELGRRRFTYDAAGRLVRVVRTRLSHKPEVFEFTHTAAGQIRTVSAPDGTYWRYGYDAFGRRVSKVRTDRAGNVLDTVVFGWDGDELVFQQNRSHGPAPSSTTWCWTHHPETGEPLTQYTRSTGPARDSRVFAGADQSVVDTEFYAIVTDLAGAPTELIDPRAGTVAGWASATLWGRTWWNGHASTALRFAGQYHDAETGLHYNRHRYYDPVTAAYTAPDPLGLAPNPSNAHAYVHNPHTWVDPLGLASCGDGWWRKLRTFGPIGAARQDYVDTVRGIAERGLARVAAGENPETVARWAIDERNAVKTATRAKLPRVLNVWAERRNVRHYGHPVGPTYEFLHDVKGKTPMDIIQGAGRTSARVNRMLGVH
ncbi:hypothetical protein IU469_13900 [Nocardia puris]|uniref:alpha/beta hydrolase n=1 Tax=Nocardia puris TaxID=208602 RepID=UPI001894604D|nr:alpha/beta hydrolase [Nocardia puris]MBF6366810.1 hypothetical protein [Nocardia puris]